jgi:nitroreductase
MDVQEAILTTRAIRRFTDEPVTDDELLTCLRAAVQAPSGGNIQPWQFLVVTDPGTKAELHAVYRRAYDRYERALLAALPPFRSSDDEASFMRTARSSRHLAEHLADAPALVLFLMPDISLTLHDDGGPLDIGPPHASVYPAVQNFMLAARGLGLGTTMTTVFRIHQDEVRAACAVPDRYQVVALVPVGRPRGRFGVARRRPAEAVTHWNHFGNRR